MSQLKGGDGIDSSCNSGIFTLAQMCVYLLIIVLDMTRDYICTMLAGLLFVPYD